MRPGRLDKLLYVGVAEDAASKAKVLAALTRKCAPALASPPAIPCSHCSILANIFLFLLLVIPKWAAS